MFYGLAFQFAMQNKFNVPQKWTDKKWLTAIGFHDSYHEIQICP